jgi:hypothetical protein
MTWADAGPVVTVIVRCDLVVCGPDVAPMWPQRLRAWKVSVPLPRIERREMRFLTPAEVARWRTASGPAIGRWRCWVPMAAFGSARWLGLAAAAST